MNEENTRGAANPEESAPAVEVETPVEEPTKLPVEDLEEQPDFTGLDVGSEEVL